MDEDVYVQSVGFELELPGGKEVFAGYIGISFCSPEEFDQIVESGVTLSELFKDVDAPIKLLRPVPLEEAIADKNQYNDIIDMVREELRKEHHDNLKEKESEK